MSPPCLGEGGAVFEVGNPLHSLLLTLQWCVRVRGLEIPTR